MFAASEKDTRAIGNELAKLLRPGDLVLLHGELGAGKTTLVRGYLEALGHQGPVRSPTFNLIQTFETTPPVMHADLYRVASPAGLGIEDYMDTHVCFIEWPKEGDWSGATRIWSITVAFAESGREIQIDQISA